MVVREDRVAAFLDWEMSAIGDWRADVGYSLMPYNAGKLLAPIRPSANQLMAPRDFLDTYLETAGRGADDEVLYLMMLGCTKMTACARA
jgi:aminoglycoside phosphotransferase (APT) family kinase protein